MKYLLDTNTIYDFKGLKDKNIIDMDTDRVIAVVNKQTFLPNNMVEFEYKIIDEDYLFGNGIILELHFDAINSRLIAKALERKSMNDSNDVFISFRINKYTLDKFRIITKAMDSGPTRTIRSFILNYVEENKALASKYLKKKYREERQKYKEQLEDNNDNDNDNDNSDNI